MYLGLLQAVFGSLKPWVCTRIRGGSGWRQGSCRKVLSEAVKLDAQPLVLIYLCVEIIILRDTFFGFQTHIHASCWLEKLFG